jgi:hypothetical protein
MNGPTCSLTGSASGWIPSLAVPLKTNSDPRYTIESTQGSSTYPGNHSHYFQGVARCEPRHRLEAYASLGT